MSYLARKKVIILLAALCIIISTIVLVAVNTSFGASTEAYAAMSLAFDKRAMQSVDRIIIRTNGTEYELTDVALVNALVEETRAATHIQPSCPVEKWIDMYYGDQLIRSMGWSSCCNTVNVYDTDAMHWVISVEGIENGGCVYLPNDLVEALNSSINNS